MFIPLLLMGGIVGRLFREFAMTVAIAVVVSAFVSLTLTPMMCARFLKHETSHGRLYRFVERGFELLLAGYRRTLDVALRFQFLTLMVFAGTLVLTVVLYLQIPKGFFPTQDTGVMLGITEAGQDVSFGEMARRQVIAADIVAKDPAVLAVSSSIGAGLGGQTGNNGRLWISLKPFEERHDDAQKVIARLRGKVSGIEGLRVYFQAAQDISVGGRLARTQYQYTLQDADLIELFEWAPKILGIMQKLPTLRDLATDQQVAGTNGHAHDRPGPGGAVRHPAAGNRRYAVRRVRPAPGCAIQPRSSTPIA